MRASGKKIVLALGVAVIGFFLLFRLAGGGVAPVPESFAGGLTIQQGIERGAQSGKPVLVLATADWCGPCQRFKRGPMSDPKVAAIVKDRFEPVYLDVDRQRELAAKLEIESVPALRVLRPGQPIAKLDEYAEATQVVRWLEGTLQS